MITLCDEHRTWTLKLSECPVCRDLAAAKEIELLRKLIEQYETVVNSQKEALDALRTALKMHSSPFGIPLPSTAEPLLQRYRCGGCGAEIPVGRTHVCMGHVEGRAG
jgi:hypothetical protein